MSEAAEKEEIRRQEFKEFCENDEVEALRVFLKERFDINQDVSGEQTTKTGLHYAAEKGKHRAVEFLVNSPGVKINASTDFGSTPLHLACEQGHWRVVKILIEQDAKVFFLPFPIF